MSRNGGTVQARFDARLVTPNELADLTDTEFRAVVDADLRRRVRPEGLSEATSNALRSPAHVDRWYETLSAIRVSVETQISGAADEYDAQREGLEAEIARLEHEGGGSGRLERLYDESSTLRTGYLEKKAARERFLANVGDFLLRAEALRSERHAGGGDDRLRGRVALLERAIEAHRRAVLADLAEDEEPARYEEALWKVLNDDD